jgi:hypothetical protein
MPWQWLPQFVQNDPQAFGQMAFVWLSAIALGISWYAAKIPRPIAPAELERLHREVDELRQEILAAAGEGRRIQRLQERLDALRDRLPSGDARRSEKIRKRH